MKRILFSLGLLCTFVLPQQLVSDADNSLIDNDANKSVKEIVEENGWVYEEYDVVTDDGYILTIYRIPGSHSESLPYKKKPVVLLQHGLESDASQWVINTPELSSAFNLASAGYDVWMGNNRGCAYSLGHVSLDPFDKHDAPLYWNFSFEEMGTLDLPATIDYILGLTA